MGATVIDKLEPSYVVGDPIMRGIVEKLNEVIDVFNHHIHETTDSNNIIVGKTGLPSDIGSRNEGSA
jgi:hypothetical protein